MKKCGWVYIITNQHNIVLYVGVTSDLLQRISSHINKEYPKSFTARYNIDKLVYYECFETIGEAILEEKRIKGGNRKQKIDLINSMNRNWDDLYVDLLQAGNDLFGTFR